MAVLCGKAQLELLLKAGFALPMAQCGPYKKLHAKQIRSVGSSTDGTAAEDANREVCHRSRAFD